MHAHVSSVFVQAAVYQKVYAQHIAAASSLFARISLVKLLCMPNLNKVKALK